MFNNATNEAFSLEVQANEPTLQTADERDNGYLQVYSEGRRIMDPGKFLGEFNECLEQYFHNTLNRGASSLVKTWTDEQEKIRREGE